MYIFSDFSKFIFYFLTYIEEECYSVVILAKSSALFHAKTFHTPCSIFFACSARKTPAFSLYKVGTYGSWDTNPWSNFCDPHLRIHLFQQMMNDTLVWRPEHGFNTKFGPVFERKMLINIQWLHEKDISLFYSFVDFSLDLHANNIY